MTKDTRLEVGDLILNISASGIFIAPVIKKRRQHVLIKSSEGYYFFLKRKTDGHNVPLPDCEPEGIATCTFIPPPSNKTDTIPQLQ